MSRTDKTRPYWVQLTDDLFVVAVRHDHRFGPCDLDDEDVRFCNTRYTGPRWDRWAQRCYRYIPAYGYSGGAWPKRKGNSWAREERKQDEGGLRTVWRSRHRPGLMLDPDGYEGNIRPRHRHQLLWDMY